MIDAYNGVRARMNTTCLADPACRTRVNVGFEITDNVFERIRDNPVEPEGHAAYWIVKHNTFVDVHAAISTDASPGMTSLCREPVRAPGQSGGRMRRRKMGGQPPVRPSLGGGGRWSAEGAGGDDAQCSAHSLGTILKLGGGNNPDLPLLDRILFFNNSLQTRSPLFRGSPAPPITSYNNAVQFTGCGKDGPRPCRQDPDPGSLMHRRGILDDRPTSPGRRLLPAPRFDGQTDPAPDEAQCLQSCSRQRTQFGRNGPHHRAGRIRRHRDGGTTQPGGRRSHLCCPENGSLATAGCALRYADGDVECTGNPGPVGALLPDGRALRPRPSFGFPFSEIVKGAQN